ncbi:lamin tail domain-containing protein [Pseudobacteriovorax antillogorgiicola]|uniref:Cytosine/adenosine deaminase n=1 Tax=Pseudobacteriovorax antillogorgiicola TaxID=1513793 RepID=A0A1Y6BFN5_9BACT|nr:lamin tail domain-containing protein [Pseudobacteriovorax antillogorgiicola]TCS57396.1 cytosine/adenosine deaminase-related metal-dependent hydrolase [Pseudobacteriovorax antillogorgiicola]SMF01600.1 Cytosine/adenosine deaminase [Pseudobacteriovorax antillogorgiicola]
MKNIKRIWLMLLMFGTIGIGTGCKKDSGKDQPPPVVGPPVVEPPVVEPPSLSLLPKTITCAQELESKTSDTCELVYQGKGKGIYIEGMVLSYENPIENGGVLSTEDGKVSCVGCDCRQAAIDLDISRISCPSGVISPALINAHDHLSWAQAEPGDWGTERFEHRNDWRGGKRGHNKVRVPGSGGIVDKSLGEIRQLMTGTVTMAGSGSAPGFVRNADDFRYMEGLTSAPIAYQTFPLESGGDYAFVTDDCSYSKADSLNRYELGTHLMHVGEGIDDAARNEYLCLSSADKGGRDVTAPNNSYVHAIALNAPDAEALARDGTSAVWSPRSNIALYGNTAPVTMYKNLGVNIALGTDWTPSGSAHMLRELQCADHLNENFFNKSFNDYELWLMATANGASALKMEKEIGRLHKGQWADIAIFKALPDSNPYRSVIDSDASKTIAVLRAGNMLYGDAALLAALQGDSCETIPGDVCGVAKRLCYSQEASVLQSEKELTNLSKFMEDVAEKYPMFFCGVPDKEPSCDPLREGEYGEAKSDLDLDQDGVNDDVDNCPNVFNPIRPFEGDKQGDHDGDGFGDACDVCPMAAGNNQACPSGNPLDRDLDKVVDLVDNCSLKSNPDQGDGDKDGFGDSCDLCLSFPNSDGTACPVGSIRTLKNYNAQLPQNEISIGAKVSLQGVVTGVSDIGYYIQDLPDENREPLESAGIFVYVNKDAKPEAGQVLKLEGEFGQFFEQLQLSQISKTELVGEGVIVEPTSVSAAEFVDPVISNKIEGMLIKIADEGEVTIKDPEDSERPFEGFFLNGVIPVSRDLGDYDIPFEGDIVRVAGIARMSFGRLQLDPRDSDDLSVVSQAPSSLDSFNASLIYLETDYPEAESILKIRLDRPSLDPVTVQLRASDANVIEFDEFLTIPANADEVFVPLKGLKAVTEPIQLIATLGNQEITTDILVVKELMPVLLTPDTNLWSALRGSTLEIPLKTDLPSSLGRGGEAVSLGINPDNAGLVADPDSLMIAPGNNETTLKLQAAQEGQYQLTLGLNGSEIQLTVTVTGRDLLITEVFNNPEGNDLDREWVELYNMGSRDIDLQNYSLGHGGTNYLYGRYQLRGVIPAGGCIVVGGPGSVDANGNPSFALAQDFKPDIQNGGDKADGIALFNTKANDIKEDTPVLDALIYGKTNSNNLVDESGTAPEPHVKTAPSGHSYVRTTDGWQTSEVSTPGKCELVAAP